MGRKLHLALICLVLAGGLSCGTFSDIKDVQSAQVGEVDLGAVDDGTYAGEFAYAGFTYVVHTTVREHRIVGVVAFKNRESNHAKMAEVVLPRVVEHQTPNVDTVSGASTTAKALLLAVENSLVDGRRVAE